MSSVKESDRKAAVQEILALRERVKELESAINKHRCAIWGVNGKVGHDQDVILYATLKETK